MSRLNPHARFLLRASAALVLVSVAWWVLLLNPLLFGFRHLGDFLGSMAFGRADCAFISETPSGDWNICLPAQGVVSHEPRSRGSRVTSIEFELARSGPIAFTFGLPVCWALLLANWDRRRSWRPFVLATAVTMAVEIVLVLVFLRTYSYAAEGQSMAVQDAVRKWFVDFSLYAELNVMPELAPFVVALGFDRGLRKGILGETAAEERALSKSCDRRQHPPPAQTGLAKARTRQSTSAVNR